MSDRIFRGTPDEPITDARGGGYQQTQGGGSGHGGRDPIKFMVTASGQWIPFHPETITKVGVYGMIDERIDKRLESVLSKLDALEYVNRSELTRFNSLKPQTINTDLLNEVEE